MESLKQSMTNMHDLFDSRMANFESQLSKETTASSTSSGIASEYALFKKFVAEMLNNLQQQVDTLCCTIDDMETRSRRKMLLLHGLPEESNEDTLQLAVKVIKQHFQFDFSAEHIKRCQRLGRHISKNPRPVLVKFNNADIRNKVWFTKTVLRGTGITVSEFLTKIRHDIFMAGRDKFGVKNCWTKDGCVYIKGANNARHKVVTAKDLEKLDIDPKVTASTKATTSKTRRAVASRK